MIFESPQHASSVLFVFEGRNIDVLPLYDEIEGGKCYGTPTADTRDSRAIRLVRSNLRLSAFRSILGVDVGMVDDFPPPLDQDSRMRRDAITCNSMH